MTSQVVIIIRAAVVLWSLQVDASADFGSCVLVGHRQAQLGLGHAWLRAGKYNG